MTTFTCALVGPGGSGKTLYINRLKTGHFGYNLPGNETNLTFKTHAGQDITFHVIQRNECSGMADCVLLMLDKASLAQPEILVPWVVKARHAYGNVPLVVCGSKVDLLPNSTDIDRTLALYVRILGITYYDLSAKTLYNQEKPWVHFARLLLNNPNLTLP